MADLRALEEATAGLLYPSESDFPIEVFSWEGLESLDEAEVLHRTGHTLDMKVRAMTLDRFFQNVVVERDYFPEERKEKVHRFRRLKELVQSELADIRVYRIGEVEVDIYVVGRAGPSSWAGLRTKAVET